MMGLYNNWMNLAAQLRRIADDHRNVGSQKYAAYLIQAEQIETCARELMKAFLEGGP